MKLSMSKSMIDYLQHIFEECRYLSDLKESGLTKEKMVGDETLKRAVVRSIEIIGEATKNIDKDFREKYSEIEWKQMAGMRDRLIHNYMGINYNIVWDVIHNKIPTLKEKIRKIIEKEGNVK